MISPFNILPSHIAPQDTRYKIWNWECGTHYTKEKYEVGQIFVQEIHLSTTKERRQFRFLNWTARLEQTHSSYIIHSDYEIRIQWCKFISPFQFIVGSGCFFLNLFLLFSPEAKFCYFVILPMVEPLLLALLLVPSRETPRIIIFFWYFTFYVASHFFFFSYLWFGQSTTAVVSLNLSTTHSFLRYIFKLSITKSSCELSFFWFCKLHGTIFHYFFWSFFGILCLVLWSCSITFFTVSKMKTNRGRSLETIGHKAKF